MTAKIQDVFTTDQPKDAPAAVTTQEPAATHAPCDPAPVENKAPVAVNDAVMTNAGAAISVDVVANDTDADGDTLAVKAVGTASNGTTTIVDGKAVYTPNDGFSSTDSFVYTVVDGNGGSSNGVVEVKVEKAVDPTPTNTAPVAKDDAVTAKGGDVAVLDVLANDTDADGDKLTITNVGTPMQGTAKLNDDGTITYTANDDAKGTDSYEYTVSDGNGGTDTATITATFEEAPVDPHPANTAPVAKDDAVTAKGGDVAVLDVLANDTDADGDGIPDTREQVSALIGVASETGVPIDASPALPECVMKSVSQREEATILAASARARSRRENCPVVPGTSFSRSMMNCSRVLILPLSGATRPFADTGIGERRKMRADGR